MVNKHENKMIEGNNKWNFVSLADDMIRNDTRSPGSCLEC